MSEKPSAIALKAAEEVRRRGLCKGLMYETDDLEVCRVCVLGAIEYGSEFTMKGSGEVCTALRKAIGSHDIATWNDAPERTAEDVIGALMLAHANLVSRGL